MDFQKFDSMTEEEMAENFDKMNPELLDKLNEADRKFMKVHQATALIESINSIDIKIFNLTRLTRKVFPDVDLDTLKILTSRMDDLDPRKVETLSFGFIQNLLTVDGKKYTMTVPNEIKQRFKSINFTEIPQVDQQRTLILAIKNSSEEIAKANEWKEKLQGVFATKVDDDIKQIISTPDNIEKYTAEYYKTKLNDESLTDEERVAIEKTIEYTEYGYNIKPLIDNLDEIIKRKSGDISSIVYGFRNNLKDAMVAANKVLAANRLTFPIAALANIEVALFGDTYKNYSFLTIYLLARYIKFKGNTINRYDRVFISQLISNIVRISRAKTNEDKERCKMIISKVKPSIEILVRKIADRA